MTVTPDIPTGLQLAPDHTTLTLRAGATTLALYDGPQTTLSLHEGQTTLALYDHTTDTTVNPGTTTLLLDG